jgi:LAS superfamily LD-carboxypeptidase LdcB
MSSLGPLYDQIHGLTDNHVVALDQTPHHQVYIHRAIATPWLQLKNSAELEGFKPFILSGFRSFQRQLTIWERKISRQVEIKDKYNTPLAIDASKSELLDAILSWSAIPGYSRHHWGTDIDIFDASCLDDHYQIKLEPCEFTEPDGPCYQFEAWLKENIEQFGFYRPYQEQNQGVAIEPWHLSHSKTSSVFMNEIGFEAFKRFIETNDIPGNELICANIQHIFDFYINNSSYRG